jgi:hypothetical protein
MPILQPARELSAQELDPKARAAGMAQVLGSLAMEGLTPSPDDQKLIDRYVAGEITADDMEAKLAADLGIDLED